MKIINYGYNNKESLRMKCALTQAIYKRQAIMI